ncbi:hypothetical protein BBK36DRAFT_1193875 [Trichoderma citrinoviride]|uniref:USP domain-containing protein n=1 Tax=Trichoderma citrinoviride TaxID=58853 RepID=A0A2T4BEQ2_9HYPO|nr:hypothetical protein BBK36DRAFT_1193875 [Trichoderma citrinoviride]PTB67813.1 hypothetical protein BBK36DRAFT_1193875 [Trichoderma citrinoviride]
MSLVPAMSDFAGPKASPEPSSTRLNPFDDSDISSRKRRRTSVSASGSPSASVETAVYMSDSSSSPYYTTVNAMPPPLDGTVKPSPDSNEPRTPPPTVDSPTIPPDPPLSNRVTINLRNPSSRASTASPTRPAREPFLYSPSADKAKKSVEEADPPSDADLETPPPAWRASLSPPTEDLFPGDQDMPDETAIEPKSDRPSPEAGSDATPLVDPTTRFPYHESDKPLSETASRLRQFLLDDLSVEAEADIYDQIRLWADLFVAFAKTASPAEILESVHTNAAFWQTFLGVSAIIADENSPSSARPRVSPIQTLALLFSQSFAALTAQLVIVDYHSVTDWQASGPSPNPAGPLLISPGYLRQLHQLIQFGSVSDSLLANPNGIDRPNLAICFADGLYSFTGGGFESLCTLLTSLAEVVRTVPNLVNILTPIAQVLTDCLYESSRAILAGTDNASDFAPHLSAAYRTWTFLSSLLTGIIEKHVGTLSSEGVSLQIIALSDMLRLCLQCDHDQTIPLLREHRAKYPDLAGARTLDAITWEWKVDILGRLIRSSQLQLRVMAATTMCNELVAAWKRFGVPSASPNPQFTDYLGRHLLQTGLVDYILGPNCHPELINESANIIGYLVVTKMYDKAHTERLWQRLTESQDPRIEKAVAKMATSITNLFDYPTLLFLCEKFQALPMKDFNQTLKNYWAVVHHELMMRCKTEGITLGFLPYDLCLRLLREAFLHSTTFQMYIPDAQIKAATEKLKGLLFYGPDSEGRQELYASCIKDIAAKSPTTLGSLCCLTITIRPNMADEMNFLIEKHDLVRLLVEELEHAIQSTRSAGIRPVFFGQVNHPRKDFIANLIRLRPDAISEDLGRKLLDLLVGPASLCEEDRNTAWEIFMDFTLGMAFENPFLRLCFSRYLPELPSSCFCKGLLNFIKKIIAEDGIHSLAVGVYLESHAIKTYSFDRARRVRSTFVERCLNQLSVSASKIKASSDGTSSGEDEPMVIVATEDEIQEQERVFTRTLQLLRVFVQAHFAIPTLSAPDFRPYFQEQLYQVEGELLPLKYQTFDSGPKTEVKPLRIGKLNTAAALISNLRHETGFSNFRIIYKGRQFLPLMEQIAQSLESLQVEDGIMLVIREGDDNANSTRIQHGASPLEIGILSRFPELWSYLSMEDKIASEVFRLLVDLPVDGHIIDLLESQTTVYTDLFPPGQPYKTLYAIGALSKYLEPVRSKESTNDEDSGGDDHGFRQIPNEEVLRSCLSLIVQAISDETFLHQISSRLSIQVMEALMQTFVTLLHTIQPSAETSVTYPSAGRLVSILADAGMAREDEASLSLIENTLLAILRLCLSQSAFMESVANHSAFGNVLHDLILWDSRPQLRSRVVNMIRTAAESEELSVNGPESVLPEEEDVGGLAYPLTRYFWSTTSALLPEVIGNQSRCQELLDVLEYLFCRMSLIMPSEVDITAFARHVCELLLSHTSTERLDKPESQDYAAAGLSSLLLRCLQLDSTLPSSPSLPDNLAEVLFQSHLFPQRRVEPAQPVPRVVLRTDTRARLYEAIFAFTKDYPSRFWAILQHLNSLVPYFADEDDGLDPYIYDLPYNFNRNQAIRSHGYVGLQNLSNTCYLNSLLTQLFMNTRFRQFVLEFNIQDPSHSQQLLFHMQKLFGFMQESYRRCVDPTDLVSSIKTYEDAMIDIHNQMDVEEFYSLLFDRLESQSMTESERKKLRSIYGGQLVQQIKSKECEHVSERLEPFSAIQCDINGKKTLQESLQAYVDGEVLEGDNKYKCSSCDQHVDAVKRTCLKDLPDNLIFHLKRFDFNVRTQQRCKVNDHFVFPPSIDMRPYTIDYLSDPTKDTSSRDVFELVGVLVHSGTAESGHYYSYIRERSSTTDCSSWVEFNDDTVTPWDPRQMAASTFGGPIQHGSPHGPDRQPGDKTYSAYMLFYQRSSSLLAEQQSMPSSPESTIPFQIDTDPLLREHILNDNTVILKRHCLYDASHAEFVQHCFKHAGLLQKSIGQDSTGQEQQQQPLEGSGKDTTAMPAHAFKDLAMEMALGHLDQLVSRQQGTPNFESFSSLIRAAVVECGDCALTFFNYFNTRHEAFRGLVQRNPEAKIRAFAGATMVIVLGKIATETPQLYDEPRGVDEDARHDGEGEFTSNPLGHDESSPKSSVLTGVMCSFDYLWQHFQFHLRSWDEVFGMMLEFAKLGPREAAHMLANDYLLKLLRIVAADVSMELPPNYAKMLHSIYRRAVNRPPSYLSILNLINYLVSQLDPTVDAQSIVDAAEDRLRFCQPPFPWTSEEVFLIHSYPERQLASLFVEKLLGIDQALEATHGILGRLTALSNQMDLRVLNTLRKRIQCDTTEPMDPYLRGAGTYLEHTPSASNIELLLRHIAAQAGSLQSTDEARAFLETFQTALNLKRSDVEMVQTAEACSLETLPDWVPHLVAFPDGEVRYETECFLEKELFGPAADSSDEDSQRQEEREGSRILIQRLGISCLLYLQDEHIRRRKGIGRESASAVVRVVARCSSYYNPEPEPDDEISLEFRTLQEEVLGSLRKYVVDEVEDDGSDWEGSCISSDALDGQPDLGVQQIGELDDANAI